MVPALLRLERDVHSDGDQRRFDDLRNRFMSDWRAWIARLMRESDQANIDPASSTALIAFLLDHIHPKRLRELCERTDPICQWSQSQAIMAHLKLSAHFHASEAMPPEQRVYMDLDWALMTDYRALASALSTLETPWRRLIGTRIRCARASRTADDLASGERRYRAAPP